MNRKRRQKLASVKQMLTEVIYHVEQVLDEEQNCADNYPENLTSSEKFDQIEDVIENLSEAIEKLEDALQNISNSISS